VIGEDESWSQIENPRYAFYQDMIKNMDQESPKGSSVRLSSFRLFLEDYFAHFNIKDLPREDQDMFPYRSTGSLLSWSGVYVQKPDLKRLAANMGYQLFSLKIAEGNGQIRNNFERKNYLRGYEDQKEASFEIGGMIHHDAITGCNINSLEYSIYKRYKNTRTKMASVFKNLVE
jgi:hypothetical protein